MTPTEIKHHQRIALLFGSRIDDIFRHGCHDQWCKIRHYNGMHTNGGCRCYRSIAEYALELAASADLLKNCGEVYPLNETPDEAEDALDSLGA